MKITRRLFASLLIAIAPLILFPAAQTPAKNPQASQYFAFIGTYTSKTTSKGIYSFRFDATTGQLTPLGVASEAQDPSFLTIAPNRNYLYAVNELTTFNGKPTGAVTAYKINRPTAQLTQLNQVPSGGPGPCFISIDNTGNHALVANYDGGSVTTFPIARDGSLQPASSFIQHTGSGPNKDRQEAPHAHWIATSPDNRFALAVDLGLDEVLIYRFDAATGALTPAAIDSSEPRVAKLTPGAGPRHLAFHPNGKFAYVLSEIKSSLTAYGYDPQSAALSPLQTLSTLPKDFAGSNDTAEVVVHPSGKFLYASNRGHDSIALFAIDPAKGTLTPAGDFSTRGKTPRNFAIDPTGKFLLAANQESNNIVVFRIDLATGALTPTGQVSEVPAPVDIVFVPSK